MLVCTLLFRLAVAGVFSPMGQLLRTPEAISFFLYLQTGRALRLEQDSVFPPIRFSPAETRPAPPVPDKPHFRPEEAAELPVYNRCGVAPDLAKLLTEPLDWDLTGGPSVLILHTHGTECYSPGPADDFQESSPYRTLDEDYNMLCLGALVARRLEEAGIGVIHDTALHDYPSYNDAYANAAASTRDYLEQYPTVRLILDLHRDAADTPYGQMVTQCSVGSETAAQLMFVVGTDAGSLSHPEWEENLSLALKLQILLERENPGICRNLNLTANRYNQHLGDYALLIEIGAAGNTLSQAALAAEELARAIIALKHGSN
jgi:stage II sporulation protein P